MYIGVDLGTSSIKIVLVDRNDKVLESSSRSIPTERPSIGHSEQNPNRWFEALLDCFDELSSKAEKDMKRVEGIGLSGHMHSAILMDSTDKPIGNAILHNDVRAEKEAHELNEKFPDLAEKAGVIAMPGFTGPKLLWSGEPKRRGGSSGGPPSRTEHLRHCARKLGFIGSSVSGDQASGHGQRPA